MVHIIEARGEKKKKKKERMNVCAKSTRLLEVCVLILLLKFSILNPPFQHCQLCIILKRSIPAV